MAHVTPIPLGFVNAFLVTDARSILVDSGNPGMEERVLRAAAGRDVALLAVTHGHLDHAGSAVAIAKRLGVPVAMGAQDAALARAGRAAPAVPLRGWVKALLKLGGDRSKLDPPLHADIIVDADVQLREFGVDGRLTPTPGHTDGSISLVTRDGHAVVGDLLNGGVPLGRGKPGAPIIGVDATMMRHHVHRLLDHGARQYYVGHGAPGGFDAASVRGWLEG